MKHIKEFTQLFENQQELTQEQKDWLDQCTDGTNGTYYSFDPQTGLVDIDSAFDCSRQGLSDFKGVRFGHVEGYFNCGNNSLTSLEGAPQSVDGDFSCASNNLTSLEGAPQTVGGWFWCDDNKLTSLKGAPQTVGGGFNCSKNRLTSLEGSPRRISNSFDCSNNRISTLKGAPQYVGIYFKCGDNQLTSLEGAPQNVGGSFYCSGNPITGSSIERIIEKMSRKKITLEQAVKELWTETPEGDKPYLAKHHPDLSPEERREYMALERHKKRLI